MQENGKTPRGGLGPPQVDAAHPWWIWPVAVALVAAVGAGFARSDLLWATTDFEQSPELSAITFAQTYQAARKLYAPPRRRAGSRVAVLGNSRILLAADEHVLNAELQDVDASVDLIAVYGGRLLAMEILSRHLDRKDWNLVVLTISPSDLLWDPPEGMVHHSIRLLEIGWRDGPQPAASQGQRTTRWLRTAWPVFRFREFARAALADRVRGVRGEHPPTPDFANTREFFVNVHGDRGAAIEAAFRRWYERRELPAYLEYLRIAQSDYLNGLAGQVARYADPQAPLAPRRSLDALLARCASASWRTRIVVMPRNPLLAQDREGRFHDAAREEAAMRRLQAAARAHGILVLDWSDAMPAEVFVDFDHLMPRLSGFDQRLAQEIRRVLES